MPAGDSLNAELSQTTPMFGLKLWIVICICVCALIMFFLAVLSIWVFFQRKTRRNYELSQIPDISKEITVDRVAGRTLAQSFHDREGPYFALHDDLSDKDSRKTFAHLAMSKSSDADNLSQCSSGYNVERVGSSHSGDDGSLGATRKLYSPHGMSHSGDDGSLGATRKLYSPHGMVSASPLVGLPDGSHLGWGHWFTLRDLEYATNHFSKENVIGEGGYGVVYRGCLINGTEVAIKKLLNNMGQAEREFRTEVEAIGHVRHKNLVRLLGYCVEGIHRMLVYEYVNNGNLDQWLHGAMTQRGVLRWESRMKIILGTAKALAYLHEAIEPKVVHRDVKSSNILIDDEFNGKVSDFGLAKLLGAGKSHVATRVMGTFGYVAPEYANSGLLNEKSDVYSFGVLLLEAVTGRDPVDYKRPDVEVNLVEWFKLMVGSRRTEELLDPNLEDKPSTRVLKRTLIVALRCVDPDSENRPKMGQVVRMLEAEDAPFREDRRNRRSQTSSVDRVDLDNKEDASASSSLLTTSKDFVDRV